MEAIVPKKVFAFFDTKPDENVYKIRIALNDTLDAVFKTVNAIRSRRSFLDVAMQRI